MTLTELDLSVLHQRDGLLAINKPPGTLVIPGRESAPGASLRERLEAALGKKVFVVHRLDRDTSGVLLFGLDADTHRAVSMAFEQGLVEKRYLALVEGEVPRALEVRAPLRPARRGRMRVALPGEEGAEAITRVAPVEGRCRSSRFSWVEARPLTGRTHQIRVHLRHAGHPLAFDHQYGRKVPLTERELGGGSDEVVLARTPLHALELKLPPLNAAEPVRVVAPLPEDMRRAWSVLCEGHEPPA